MLINKNFALRSTMFYVIGQSETSASNDAKMNSTRSNIQILCVFTTIPRPPNYSALCSTTRRFRVTCYVFPECPKMTWNTTESNVFRKIICATSIPELHI